MKFWFKYLGRNGRPMPWCSAEMQSVGVHGSKEWASKASSGDASCVRLPEEKRRPFRCQVGAIQEDAAYDTVYMNVIPI